MLVLHFTIFLFSLFITIGSGLIINHYLNIKYKYDLEIMALSLGFGFIVIIYSTSLLSFMNFLGEIQLYLLACILFFLSIIYLFNNLKISIIVKKFKNYSFSSNYYLTTLICLTIFLYFLSTISPVLDGDSLTTYLDIPRRYLYHNSIVSLPFELYNSTPLNMQMLSAFSLAIGGDVLAQMNVGFTMTVGTAIVLLIISRRIFSLEIGLYAMLFFLTTYVVEFLVPSVKVNSGRAFFDLLSIYSIFRFFIDDKERKNKWLIISGVFSGTAFGCQYPSGIMAFFIMLIIGFYCLNYSYKKGYRNSFYSMLAYGIMVIIFSSPWLIKNYLETGNPFFPVLNSIFLGNENLITESLEKANIDDGNIFSIFWFISTGFTASGFGKPIGPVFLALLPGIFYIKKIPKSIIYGLIFILILYIIWYYFGVKRPRHLLSEIALLSIISGWILVKSKSQFNFFYRMFIVYFGLLYVFQTSIYARLHFYKVEKLKYIFGYKDRTQFLNDNINVLSKAYPNWAITNFINKLEDSTTVISMYVGNDFYIKPEINFIDSRIVDLSFYNTIDDNVQSIVKNWEKVSADYLFVNKNYLGNPQSSNFSDYRLILSENFKKMYLTLVYEFDSQEIYKIKI